MTIVKPYFIFKPLSMSPTESIFTELYFLIQTFSLASITNLHLDLTFSTGRATMSLWLCPGILKWTPTGFTVSHMLTKSFLKWSVCAANILGTLYLGTLTRSLATCDGVDHPRCQAGNSRGDGECLSCPVAGVASAVGGVWANTAVCSLVTLLKPLDSLSPAPNRLRRYLGSDKDIP